MFMREAYDMARFAVGQTAGNPAVGAIVVNKTSLEILGKGFTGMPGEPHAEVMAIQDAILSHGKDALQDAALYVTLEPCTFKGRTPACTTVIAKTGIREVVADYKDFHPKVNGKSVTRLKNNQIDCRLLHTDPAFTEEAWFTSGAFAHKQLNGRARIIVKWAQGPGGVLAPVNGASGPISSAEGLEAMHRLRGLYPAILATPGAVKHDMPRLTSRPLSNRLNYKGSLPYLSRLLKIYEQKLPISARRTQPIRFFWMPRISEQFSTDKRKQFLNVQKGTGGRYILLTSEKKDYELFKRAHHETRLIENDIDHVIQVVSEYEINEIMIETGPTMADLWVQKADALMIFISQKELNWAKDKKSRSFHFSRMIDRGNFGFISENTGFSGVGNLFFDQTELQLWLRKQ